MQRSRREWINVERGPVVASQDAAKFVDECADAKITMLREYLSRRGRNKHGVAQHDSWRPRGDLIGPGRERRLAPATPRCNLLLAALDAEDRACLIPHLEFVPLPRGKVVGEAPARSDYAYFPTAGIVSLLCELESGASVEVAAAGNDGMVGTAVFMGASATTGRAVVRNDGEGYRIAARVLRNAFESSAALRRLLLRYAQAVTAQIAQTAVCLCRHKLEQQLCRILLVTIDRLATTEVDLTQDAIAAILGVRRESITAAAGGLQASGLIRYRRGRITVPDRRLLEERVCECYAAARAALDPLWRPRPRAVDGGA